MLCHSLNVISVIARKVISNEILKNVSSDNKIFLFMGSLIIKIDIEYALQRETDCENINKLKNNAEDSE